MTLSQTIQETLDLDKKATPGPWLHHENIVHCSKENGHERNDERICHGALWPSDGPENLAAIAHYRTSAPQLARACAVMKEALKEADFTYRQAYEHLPGQLSDPQKAILAAEEIIQGEKK